MPDRKSKGPAELLLGGLSSMMACFVTHPLDLLKVRMQMNSVKVGERPPGVFTVAGTVIRTQGLGGLYKGLSAALMRQATYSTTRFGVYDAIKDRLEQDGRKLNTVEKFGSAMFAGACGGVAGNPMDVANVRMQVSHSFSDNLMIV